MSTTDEMKWLRTLTGSRVGGISETNRRGKAEGTEESDECVDTWCLEGQVSFSWRGL